MRMNDGSRHFGGLPETYDVERPQWHAIREHVARLSGATLAGFVTDEVTEAWIDFDWRGHRFSINDQLGEWWFFVADPTCDDDTMRAVLDHFEALLDPAALRARAAGPIAPGCYRTVVIEADARTTTRDFADLAAARSYADAASKTEHGVVLAYVVDEHFRVVHTATHD
jgi:hypothetical protein